MKRDTLKTSVFGASDGLIATLAIVLASASRGRVTVLLALFGLFVAEGLGMAAAEYLAEPTVSLRQAAVMGVATGSSILLVGLPWCFAGGNVALYASVLIALLVGAGIAQVRPGGWQTWASTFGVLVAVATITGAVGKLT